MTRIALTINSLILTFVALFFFLIPLVMLIHDVHAPSLHNGDMPQITYRWHRQLSDDFADWAEERTLAGTAASVDVLDVSGTEWPMFSAVFFLWASEALQQADEHQKDQVTVTPGHRSRRALDAAVELIVDPNNATWVKQYWGDNYLHQENIFYRMLLISGLTSYQKLTGNDRHQSMLEDQVRTLSDELERSSFGLLDDYPRQCYPIDILPAIAAIKRADVLLGTDRSAFVQRSIRGFEQERLDPLTQLPAYVANSKTGTGIGPARGVGIAYMLVWAPELWPQTAEQWYLRYENHFWQSDYLLSSVREFSRHSHHADWQMDVDAGPVFAGIGTAASAFGIGAARANGRMDHAFALSTEALVASWPLPNGTLLIPRLLSNLSDAPYVGEAALLFSLSRMPVASVRTNSPVRVPLIVYGALVLYALPGLALLTRVRSTVRYLRRLDPALLSNTDRMPCILWLIFATGGLVAIPFSIPVGIALLLLAILFPRIKAIESS